MITTVFNVYIGNMPNSRFLMAGYANDWVMAHPSKDCDEIEKVLRSHTTVLKKYFDKWYLN